MNYHNKERKTVIFKEVPFDVTRDDVDERNDKIMRHNDMIPATKA